MCFLSQNSPREAAPQWLLLILADEAGLSKSPANPISPYTKHTKGVQAGSACTFISQTASGTQIHISACCLPLGTSEKSSVATCARPDSPFPSPTSLEDEGTSSRTR